MPQELMLPEPSNMSDGGVIWDGGRQEEETDAN